MHRSAQLGLLMIGGALIVLHSAFAAPPDLAAYVYGPPWYAPVPCCAPHPVPPQKLKNPPQKGFKSGRGEGQFCRTPRNFDVAPSGGR
jgi:hypothetical protein